MCFNVGGLGWVSTWIGKTCSFDEEYGCRGGFIDAQCYVLHNSLGYEKTFMFHHLFNEDG
jgi:hypothetical protein